MAGNGEGMSRAGGEQKRETGLGWSKWSSQMYKNVVLIPSVICHWYMLKMEINNIELKENLPKE